MFGFICAFRVSPVAEQTPSVLNGFVDAVKKHVEARKRWFLDEFGSDDYGVIGMVVVGSVAAGTERPDSDIDLYLLAKSDGDLDEFQDALLRLSERPVDVVSVIRVDQGQEFEPKDWAWLDEEQGYHHTEHVTILF